MNDLSQHRLLSLTDDTWIKEYSAKMGEDKLYEYKNKVYKQLYSLEFGKSMSVIDWVQPENYDLFIKVACCFISESNGCYLFYNNFTIIKHKFDAREMENISKIFARKHQHEDSGSDVGGIESGQGNTSFVSASPQTV